MYLAIPGELCGIYCEDLAQRCNVVFVTDDLLIIIIFIRTYSTRQKP